MCDHKSCRAKGLVSFTCKLCSASYCTRHRLPEDHACVHLKAAPSADPPAASAPAPAPLFSKKEKLNLVI